MADRERPSSERLHSQSHSNPNTGRFSVSVSSNPLGRPSSSGGSARLGGDQHEPTAPQSPTADMQAPAWTYTEQLQDFRSHELVEPVQTPAPAERDTGRVQVMEMQSQSLSFDHPAKESVTSDDPDDDSFHQTMTRHQLEDIGKVLRKVQTSRRQRELQALHAPMVLCSVTPLTVKSAAEEVRVHKDLLLFATGEDNSVPLLDMRASTVPEITDLLLAALVKRGYLQLDEEEKARHELLAGSPESSTGVVWARTVQGQGFVLALATLGTLNHRMLALGRLRTPANLGLGEETMMIVGLVLGSDNDKQTKSVVETGQTFASLLSDPDFRATFRKATQPSEIEYAALTHVRRQIAAHEQSHAIEEERKGAAPSNPLNVALEGGRKPLDGLLADIKRRFPSWPQEFTDGFKPPEWDTLSIYLSATLVLFFACICPCLAFGALWNDTTKGTAQLGPMGVSEIVFSEALCGILFSLLGGQPLLVFRASGPIAVFGAIVYSWSMTLGLPFLPFYACVGLWAAFYCALVAIFNLSKWASHIGRFTEEAFALMISCIFLSKALKHVIHDSTLGGQGEKEPFLLTGDLVLGVYLFATFFVSFRTSMYLRPSLRNFLHMFGPVLAFVIMTAFSYLQAVPVAVRLSEQLPEELGIVTTDGRPWFVDFSDADAKTVLLAAAPAIPLMMLVYLEQNVSGLLINRPEAGIKNGAAFHWDFLILGLLLAICSVMGLPWCHGALPHSIIHPRLLADVEDYHQNGITRTRIVRSRVTRWTNLGSHILFLLLIAVGKPLLGLIPKSALYGYFLFLGASSLGGNHLVDRLLLLFMQPENYPPTSYVRRVPIRTIHLFTLCQMLAFAFLWLVHENFYIKTPLMVPPSLLFPVCVFLLIPFRKFVLPRIIPKKYVEILTADEAEDAENLTNYVGIAAHEEEATVKHNQSDVSLL